MPFDRRQNGTVIGMGDRQSRICLERAGYQLEPFGGFSALMQENAVQMERVEIARLNGEDLPVQRLGFLQLPTLMVRGRAPKRLYDDGICGGRLDLRFRHGLEGVAKATESQRHRAAPQPANHARDYSLVFLRQVNTIRPHG